MVTIALPPSKRFPRSEHRRSPILAPLAIFALVNLPRYASADIEVTKSAGADVSPDKETRIELKTDGGTATIYEVLAETQISVSGFGAGGSISGGGGGQTLRKLCEAPCELKLRGGQYTLQVGSSMLLGESFTVRADGVPKVFLVEDQNTAGGVTGMILGILGTAGAIGLPLSALLLGGEEKSALFAAGGACAGVGLIGWIWMFASFADVEQIPP
jgi:hypothetical protein